MKREMQTFVSVPLGLSGNGDWPGLSTHTVYFVLNSQLWGELQPAVVRKGLQPATLALCGFPLGLLFPVIAIYMSTLLEYSMPEFEMNV